MTSRTLLFILAICLMSCDSNSNKPMSQVNNHRRIYARVEHLLEISGYLGDYYCLDTVKKKLLPLVPYQFYLRYQKIDTIGISFIEPNNCDCAFLRNDQFNLFLPEVLIVRLDSNSYRIETTSATGASKHYSEHKFGQTKFDDLFKEGK